MSSSDREVRETHLQVLDGATGMRESGLITPIEWSKEFSVNHAELDNQHKMLVAMINRCIAVVLSNQQPGEGLGSILDEMLKYAYFHFDYEEQFMREEGHSYLSDHQREHLQFLVYIKDAMARFDRGLLPAVDLLKFLKDWFVHHILGMDQLYARR